MATIVDTILNPSSPDELQAAYNTFFLDKEAIGAALRRPKEDISALLLQGALVTQTSYTTTFIAKQLQKLTGTVFVDTNWVDYNRPLMYSLALAAEVDPGVVQLTERQAEVAFALAACWTSSLSSTAAGGPPGAGSGVAGGPAVMDADEEAQATHDSDEEEEPGPLAWEPQEVPLPADLAAVQYRFVQGSLQVDAKALLDGCPRWLGLKPPGRRQESGPSPPPDAAEAAGATAPVPPHPSGVRSSCT